MSLIQDGVSPARRGVSLYKKEIPCFRIGCALFRLVSETEMFMVTTSVTVDTRGQGAIYVSHPRVTRELRGYPRVCHE